MLKSELKKVLGRPVVWGIILGFLMVNVVFLFMFSGENFSASSYKELWNQYEKSGKTVELELQTIKQKKEKLFETEEKTKDLYDRFAQELESVSCYSTYRKKIQENAKNMGILSSFSENGSFAKRNIEKTGKHFQAMPMVSVQAAPSLGVEKFFSMHTAILTIILLLYIGYLLFVREKEMGIFPLLKTTYHGKTRLCISKLCAHILSMLTILVLMYGSNFVVLKYTFGLGNLNRSIQSVLAYVSCGSVLSVKSFLGIGMLLLGLLMLAILLVLDLVCVITENASKTFLITVGIAIILLVGNSVIALNSYIGWMKYLSPAFCLDVGEVLGKYVNLNLFNTPITYLYACIFLYAAIGIVGFCSLLFGFCFVREKKQSKGKTVLAKNKGEKKYSQSLFLYELFKTSKSGHILVIFSLFLLISIFISYRSELLFEDEDEYYYYTYMQQLEGETSAEKDQFLNAESERFREIKRKQQSVLSTGTNNEMELTELSESLRPYNGFLRAEEKRKELEKKQLSDYVYETGYQQLFSFEKGSENPTLLLVGMLLLAFVLSPIFAADKEQHMDDLLRLTENGCWRRRKCKIQCAILLCIITFVILFLPQWITFFRLYGLQGIQAPVQCIGKWLRLGFRVPIWLWMVVMYIIRLAILGLISVAVLMVSNQSKSIFVTIMVFVVVAVGGGIMIVV